MKIVSALLGIPLVVLIVVWVAAFLRWRAGTFRGRPFRRLMGWLCVAALVLIVTFPAPPYH